MQWRESEVKELEKIVDEEENFFPSHFFADFEQEAERAGPGPRKKGSEKLEGSRWLSQEKKKGKRASSLFHTSFSFFLFIHSAPARESISQS